jgi:hypothetical protein
LKYPPFPWAQNFQDGTHQTTGAQRKISEKGTIFFGHPVLKMLTDELKGLSCQQDRHKYIHDIRRTRNIKLRIATGKSSIQQKGSCHQQPEHKFKKETNECYIWSIALYGAAMWTMQKADQK